MQACLLVRIGRCAVGSGDVINNGDQTADDDKAINDIEEASQVGATMENQTKGYHLRTRPKHSAL